MGTNFYLQEKPPCSECKREFERLHIGKSSGGWCFSLHVIPELGINNLSDWENRWYEPGATIWNEYDEQVSPSDMYMTIAERPPDQCRQRHDIGRYCLGWGDGTYDFVPGEFS
jgi:hypothetical protein